MPKRSEKPIEERHYGHIYLVLAGLLALTTFWAIWDMIKVRSPWQSYQAQLKDLEVSNLQSDLGNAQQTLNDQQGAQLASLETELSTARAIQQERKMPYTLASFNRMLSRILCVSPQPLISLACGR